MAAGNLGTFPHSAVNGNANDAIIAIETELGLTPSGAFSTVAARFTDIEADVVALQTLGMVGYVSGPSTDSGLTAVTAVQSFTSTSVGWTADPALYYKTTISVTFAHPGGFQNIWISTGVGTGVVKGVTVYSAVAATYSASLFAVETGLSGSVSRGISVSGLIGTGYIGSGSRQSSTLVECIG